MSQSDADFILQSGEVFPWQKIRLPSFVTPVDYVLYMQPDLGTFENIGNVKISFIVTSETDFIVLHLKNLSLIKTKLFDNSELEIPIIKILEYSKYEQLYIKANGTLKPGRDYVLCIDFKNKLEEKLTGFYLSSYTSPSGQKRYLACTHFEPTFARMAFPCFDEPAMKATFKLTILHKDEYKVYSNTEIKQTSPRGDGLILSEFEKSVHMSTYLMAFIVCDFKKIECTSPSGIKIRVIVPAEVIHEAEFALTTASKVLTFYETFFGIKYPLPKLDMVAIPDFASGAMENWGLITYRMANILCNPLEASYSRQEHIVATIAHELAHQWFGNLVTMEWWNDLWLNEGFATFVSYLGSNHAQPDWNAMDQITVDITQFALGLDCLNTSHPIMANVENPYEIKAIYDRISYSKGAAVIYMLLDALGMESFTKGISYYLNKYQFKNAKTEDLWNAFNMVAKIEQDSDVAKVMDTWILQKGFPVIYANYNNGIIKVHQERFLLVSSNKNIEDADIHESPFGYLWHVPVSYISNEDSTKKIFWLNAVDGEFSLQSKISWVKLNVVQAGFYRVMYNEEMWIALIKQMHNDHMVFSPSDRANLLDDALTLARVGILKTHLAMDLTKYLEKEHDYVPWNTAITHFNYIFNMLYETEALPLFEKYVLKLLKPVLASLGWRDEGSHLTKKLRDIILRTAIKCKDGDSIKEAKAYFDKWMTNGESISPNLRSVIYGAAIKNGGNREWQFCWNKYQETEVTSEKILLLSVLSQTQDYWQLSKYLNYSLDKDKIRTQDMATVIARSSLNPVGRFLTWRFVRMHWTKLFSLFSHTFSIKTIVFYTLYNFNTKFDQDEVKSFFGDIEVGAACTDVKQGMENIAVNIYWKENAESFLVQWLQQNV